MKEIIALTIIALLAFGCAAQQSPSQPSNSNQSAPSNGSVNLAGCNYSGTWNDTWGVMNLTQSGNELVGFYQDANVSGMVNGTIANGAYTGTWSEQPTYAPPQDAGDEAFQFANDCNTLNGTFQYGAHQDGEPWNGTLHATRIS